MLDYPKYILTVGNQSDQWIQHLVDMDGDVGRILIEASRGGISTYDTHGDIAVDSISVTTGSCQSSTGVAISLTTKLCY